MAGSLFATDTVNTDRPAAFAASIGVLNDGLQEAHRHPPSSTGSDMCTSTGPASGVVRPEARAGKIAVRAGPRIRTILVQVKSLRAAIEFFATEFHRDPNLSGVAL